MRENICTHSDYKVVLDFEIWDCKLSVLLFNGCIDFDKLDVELDCELTGVFFFFGVGANRSLLKRS